jgi:hypothetical protein
MQSLAVLSHPLPLMLSTVSANAAVEIGGVGSMFEVVPPGCRQGGLKRCRPLPVHPGQTPNLIRCQVHVVKHRPERLARVDSVEELLPQFGWSRFCALALPNAFWVSACAALHGVQRHPACQPADVPCLASVTARTLVGPLTPPRSPQHSGGLFKRGYKNDGCHDDQSQGQQISNGDAVGGSKSQQHWTLNRPVDKYPDHSAANQSNRQPSQTSHHELLDDGSVTRCNEPLLKLVHPPIKLARLRPGGHLSLDRGQDLFVALQGLHQGLSWSISV